MAAFEVKRFGPKTNATAMIIGTDREALDALLAAGVHGVIDELGVVAQLL